MFLLLFFNTGYLYQELYQDLELFFGALSARQEGTDLGMEQMKHKAFNTLNHGYLYSTEEPNHPPAGFWRKPENPEQTQEDTGRARGTQRE